jgi:hypothetical protein
MSAFREIARELHALEFVHSQLVAIGTRTDDQRQHDLIGLRRRFAEQMAEVARLGEPIFAASPDRGLEQTYRNLFSKLRTAAAVHQANWPAVRIAEADEQYRRSAVGVGEAHGRFVAWMRETLPRLEHGR